MRQFLSALPAGQGTYEVTIGASADAVGAGGLVSPVFPAFEESTEDLGAHEALLLCFARSPAQVLSTIQNELPRELRSRTVASYGLASVLLFGGIDELRDVAATLEPFVQAWELWPLHDSVLTEADISRFVREPAPPDFAWIDSSDLPYDAACQVRQLNTNLALAIHRASVFTPELVGAFLGVAQAASGLVDELRVINGDAPSLDSVRKHHYYLSRLLEVNAGLSMVVSQTLGGIPPMMNSEYPVAEYSLLGIGAASRALWSFYNHLRGNFASANHVQRVATNYKSIAAFDPCLNWNDLDYSRWEQSPAKLGDLPMATLEPASPHLLHFSSRFGFHETEYTLGASWQSLHASSSQEWHLLTVTHEFLHSQVRQLTAAIYPADTDWDRVSAVFAGAAPSNALESMQVALAQAMLRYSSAQENARNITEEGDRYDGPGYNERPSADELVVTLDVELRNLQEVVVHVLDFLYTFGADARRYLAAIWQSWSTVPSVTERIHDYLLRSLCALAADSIAPNRDSGPVFEDVHRKAVEHLAGIAAVFESPVIDEALAYLKSGVGVRRLGVEFSQAYYITRLTKTFLFDPEVAADLRRDDLTALIDGSDRLYVYDPGEYPDRAIGSALAFLSDRFGQETALADADLEFASLWQLLLLVDPECSW